MHTECTSSGRVACAKSLEEFVGACDAMLTGSVHARIVPAALDPLVGLARAARPHAWTDYLRCPDGTLEEIASDLVFSSALNGGYFYRHPQSGQVTQWEKEGSGSRALASWLRRLHEEDLLPFGNHAGPGGRAAYAASMQEALSGTPYAAQRLAIVMEMADGLEQALGWLLQAVVRGTDGRYRGRLGLPEVDHLASALPLSFGEDPFRKKACLAIMMLAGNLRACGHDVDAELPIPADYQIPRILHWAGAIDISDGLEGRLRHGGLLDPRSEEVQHFRAAAVTAAHRLGKMAGTPDWLVDGALFNVVRNDPAFRATSLPPMHIEGMWF